MVGIVIVSHCEIGKSLIEAAAFITGKVSNVVAVSVKGGNVEDLKRQIEEAIKKVDAGKGVLILTDMFGGTPSNISYSFWEPGKIEVITGVNLPMLLGAVNKQDEMKVEELAQFVKQKAQASIIWASEELG